MKKVTVLYGVWFGSGDASDWFPYEIELTDEEEVFYNQAVEEGIPFEDVPELEDALSRAYDEISENELDAFLDCDDPYVLECQGENEMSAWELTELVHDRDPHALAFFGLENATDEELAKWDAMCLAHIPTVAEFDESFEPTNPFDEGWELMVEFDEPDYDEDDDEDDEEDDEE